MGGYDIKNLVKRYPQFELSIPELTLVGGEVFSILGPSGAGKTTLLRLLNFLEQPDAGEVSFDGQTYRAGAYQPPLEVMREITTVFQRPALLSTTVWQNIIYPLKIRGLDIPHDEIESLMEQLGIAHLGHQSCTTLSGGEAQRVALARALVFKPKVLLLDEPTANLDPQNIKIIEEMVVKYVRQDHKPVVAWITHNHFQAKRVGDRICLIEDGQIVEVSPKEVFFEDPRAQRTKDFLAGNMFY
ncbi:MAG: ABC transporter ATP-binding protein [Limnochordia bacterium]|jgi:tungstate transport system ATP-binding protein